MTSQAKGRYVSTVRVEEAARKQEQQQQERHGLSKEPRITQQTSTNQRAKNHQLTSGSVRMPNVWLVVDVVDGCGNLVGSLAVVERRWHGADWSGCS